MAAYTVGRDVVLGRQASSSSLVRSAILSHELAHAAQQADAARSAGPEARVVPGHHDAEVDADRSAPAAFAAMEWSASVGGAARPRRTGLQLQGCPSDCAGTAKSKEAELKARKAQLDAATARGSGKSFSQVGAAYAELKDVSHDLAVEQTGRGLYKGTKSGDSSAATKTDCTQIVFEVLRNTFAQQGRSADWAKVEKKYQENITARGGSGGSGIDLQAALQSELGWKGIYWAPDPSFAYTDEQVSGAKGTEASYTAGVAKSKGTYYANFGKKGYPGVSIDHRVTNYGPEKGSTTTADTTGLAKLKKLPFGVMSAHGGFHMTIISYGKVIEVHWAEPSTSPDVITQDDLATWAIGPKSGIRYFASGAIVAPAADIDAAFR